MMQTIIIVVAAITILFRAVTIIDRMTAATCPYLSAAWVGLGIACAWVTCAAVTRNGLNEALSAFVVAVAIVLFCDRRRAFRRRPRKVAL